MIIAVKVHRAQKTGGEEAPNLSIRAIDPFPTLLPSAALDEYRLRFAEDAKIIADALYATLPGGTLDQLLREMLERRASHFVVKF